MATAALVVALLGAGAIVWGHRADSVLLFYPGVVLLMVALGPLAFAGGRDRWPPALLRAGSVGALVLLAVLTIESVWAVSEAMRSAPSDVLPRMVVSYADARANPEAFRRWREYSAKRFRTRPIIHRDDPTGVNPFALRPDSELMAYKSRIRINSLGFRGREIERQKAGKYRIVALGESTTFGYTLLADDAPWPQVLERLIEKELDCEAPVEVVNGGVPGWTLTNQLRRLDHDILPLRPDLVISYHGYNGFNYFFKALPSMLVQEPPVEVQRPSRLLAQLENALSRRRFLRRYEGARELTRSVARVDLGTSGYARRYRELARRLARRNAILAVATFNMAITDESPEDVVAFYEEVFPDVRARLLANRMHTKLVKQVPLGPGVIVIDTGEGLDGAYESLYVDVAHLTQEGRERLARSMLDGIRGVLERSPRLRCRARSAAPSERTPQISG